jgi:hypothetical protein
VTGPITDTLTLATSTALRDCLRDQSAHTPFGPVFSAVVRHGAPGTPTMDGCDCSGPVDVDGVTVEGQGVAYVRVNLVEPADLSGRSQQRPGGSGFGNTRNRCGSAWVVTYELGLLRCWPIPEDGKPLPDAQQHELAAKFGADRVALQRAIDCCPYLDRHSGVDLARMTAVGPAGGCAGWSATIRVRQVRG